MAARSQDLTPTPGLLARLAIFVLIAGATSASSPEPRIAPWAWTRTEAGATAPVLVVLDALPDLSAASTLPDLEDRRRFVHLALVRTARDSQAPLRAMLSSRGIAHRSFVIANVLALEADRPLLLELAAFPGVSRITGDPPSRLALPEPVARAKSAEWNVARIGADTAWAAGFRGEGIVVGIADTGIRWTHETLRAQYRGTSAGPSHARNWHDAIHAGGVGGPCGTDSPEPCDDSGHGTHVAGIIVGGDPLAEAIGVAPGAQWIGCRNMDLGEGSPSRYLECLDFFLAPWPPGGDASMGDPLLAADLTSSSWTCSPGEGCDWDTLLPAFQAQAAAGILAVAAAGNAGPACESIGEPPALHDDVVAVGASDANDAIADFSSRGPITLTGAIKPDLVAPGVGIRSALADADDAYGSRSGTSMAAPHVAGAIALLWSARPAYRGRIEQTRRLLERSALRLPAVQEGCGGDDIAGPNATWGHGRLDLTRALAEACLPAEADCTDAFDDDCDDLLDCDDPDCLSDAACEGADLDGDGVPNTDDCAPADPGAFASAGAVSDLRLARAGGSRLLLSWTAPLAGGPVVTHDIASGLLDSLRAGDSSGACLAVDLPGDSFLLDPESANRWFLVRAGNACGPTPAGWGADSLGRARSGCP